MSKSRDQHLFGDGPKRILSLDGGGVRGLISLGILKRVEDILKTRSPVPHQFRLSDYFDLIGGTSTGALIATLLALGQTVDDITKLYFDMCPRIFGGSRWLPGYWSKFDATSFDKIVKATFDKVLRDNNQLPHEPTMGSDLLKTGVALVTKRIDTGSVWVQTNNPRHKFWDSTGDYWGEHWSRRPEIKFFANRSYSLRKVAQASASAPYYLDAVEMDISKEERGLFFDGGVSPFNNPSMELFLMTTLKDFTGSNERIARSPHGFGWETGEDKLYMMSIGTGTWRNRASVDDFRRLSAAGKAVHALRGIISDAEKAAVIFMQSISDTPPGHYVDLNLDAMEGLRIQTKPLLTFRRINPLLDEIWLKRELGEAFGYGPRIVKRLHQIDLAEKANLQRCHEIGTGTGQRYVKEADFPKEFNIQE